VVVFIERVLVSFSCRLLRPPAVNETARRFVASQV
jgi:hypothetical protein